MTKPLVRERRLGAVRTAGLALAAGSVIIWSGLANAATPPDSFSALAKKVTPAVVNIASSHRVEQGEGSMPELPFDLPEGSPLERFFKQFRDQMGQNGDHPAPRTAMALGSGFIIDPSGYVVTNNHVIDGADNVKVRLEDDTVYPAKVIGADLQTDLALLKIDAKAPLPAVAFGDSDKAEVGDWIMAVGNPFGLGGTVTAGIISARGRNIQAGPYDDFLQIDAPINRGNSGGPLFDLDGHVVGINTAIYSPNGGSVGIGFAIPSNIAKTVITQLKDKGKVERGWLGVQIQKVTPELADAVGLNGTHGAMVVEVTPHSPAEKAGLKQGDVIIGFDGHEVANPRHLARTVAEVPAGTSTKVTVWRDHDEKQLRVNTGQQPASFGMASNDNPQPNSSGSYKSSGLNAKLATLTPDRRSQFDIDDNVKGVLVLDIDPGPAFEQGLRAGDVIQQVGQKQATSPAQVDELINKMAAADRDKAVLLLVKRQGHDLFLGLKPHIA